MIRKCKLIRTYLINDVCLQGFAKMIWSEATPKSSKVLISVLLAQSKFDPNLIMSFMISRSGLDFMAKMIKTYILCESKYCNEDFQYHALSCWNDLLVINVNDKMIKHKQPVDKVQQTLSIYSVLQSVFWQQQNNLVL